jgi:hypothetical protein
LAITLAILVALVVIVLGVLIWAVRHKPTKFRLTLKLWKLIHLELESETQTPK